MELSNADINYVAEVVSIRKGMIPGIMHHAVPIFLGLGIFFMIAGVLFKYFPERFSWISFKGKKINTEEAISWLFMLGLCLCLTPFILVGILRAATPPM